jgi:hypothetical protein
MVAGEGRSGCWHGRLMDVIEPVLVEVMRSCGRPISLASVDW